MDLTISLTGQNGDTITFDWQNYMLLNGLKGFGVPDTKVRIDSSATEGGIFRYSKRGIREVDLPIHVAGLNRADTETKLRRLANILQNGKGAARLTATNTTGDSFYLDVYYMGGAETVYGDTGNYVFAEWLVTLQAPQPYWQSGNASTFSVGSGTTGRGLLPQLTKLKLTSSQALGTVVVNNTGDVPTYPVWTLYGPLATVTISPVGGNGFTYNAAIASGDVVTIDTFKGTVTNTAGTNLYGNLASAPKLFTLDPGTTSVTVSGTGAGSGTLITCTYYPRREVIH